MVFFVCNHCGESLKKVSVEKHYNTRCRGALKNVSCMDCNVDFRNEDYVAHTKCITEAQKYSGKDYVAKESKNSNAKKQESWTEIIRTILESREYNLQARTRNAFQRLQNAENVPRKKAKFENFVTNCIKMSMNEATEVWNVLEKELAKMKEAKQIANAATKSEKEAAKQEKETKVQNGNEIEASQENGNDAPVKKKSKKEANIETAQVEGDKFQWASVLEEIVAERSEGIKVKKLQNKVIKLYEAKLTTKKLAEKQRTKFDKKFLKHLESSALEVKDGMVTLKANDKEEAVLPKNGTDETVTKKSKKRKVVEVAEEDTETNNDVHDKEAALQENGKAEPAKKKSKKQKFVEVTEDATETVRDKAEDVGIVANNDKEPALLENGKAEPAKKKSKKQKVVEVTEDATETVRDKAEDVGIVANNAIDKKPTLQENGKAEPAKKKSKKQKVVEVTEDATETVRDKAEDVGIVTNNAIDKKPALQENGKTEPVNKKSKKQKKATETLNNTEKISVKAAADEFPWATEVAKILGKHTDGGIAVEKLKEKLRKKYAAKLGAEAQKMFHKKFLKHIRRSPAVKVTNDVVTLC